MQVIPTYIMDDPDQYALGSWVKGNVGNIMQGVGGVLSVIPVTSVAGIALAGAGKVVQNNIDSKEAEQAQKDEQLQNYRNDLIRQRLSGDGDTMQMANFANGGLPHGSSTYQDSKLYMQLFPDQMAIGEKVEYEHTGNTKLARRIASDHIKDYLKMTGTPDYYTAMKEAGISDELNKMEKGGYFEYKNGGIYIKPSKRGSFTKWAKEHNMSVQEAARKVMANKENYSSAIVKKANFAKNFAHADGGYPYHYFDPDYIKFKNGGHVSSEKAKEILRDGTANGYKLTDKQKRYFGWIAGGAKAGGGETTPVYARQYGQPTIFQPGSYLFQPSDGQGSIENNYYYPEAIYNKAGSMNVSPAILGSDVGYIPFTDRTDLPPAGYRTINGNDTTFTYRNILKDRMNNDSIVYSPGNRKDVQRSMNRINNPSGNGDATPLWMKLNNAALRYKQTTGDNTNSFANGGLLVDDFLTEYKTGGTHEENPIGGIPIGGNSTVEQGEYKFVDPENGSEYIFSNRF